MISFTQLKVPALLFAFLLVATASAQPTVQWRFKIKAPIIGSPVAADGVAFFGALDSMMYAVDIQTGSLKWKLRTNGEIRSTPIVHNNQLFLAGGNGVLACIDKNSGKRLWSAVFDYNALFLAERRYDFADYYHSSPIVHNNVIYLGSGDGNMHAFKVENGELLWTFKTGDIIHNTAVVVKDKLCFGSFDGYVYALKLSDGSLAWKFKAVGQKIFPKGEINSSAAANDNTIFIGSRDFNSYAINVDGGYAIWNMTWAAWAPSYTVKDTVVYIGTSDDHVLMAVDARNGQQIWKMDTKFNIFGKCVVTPTAVYVGTIWGRLLAVDPKTGLLKWIFDTDGHTANHDNYFKKDDTYQDKVLSMAPVQWIAAEYKMGGIWSTPLVVGEKILITTAEGTLYCLNNKP
ncbi:MAG: PQQ-binding-like beta-propeller repeat protein [Bacteroidota bacterium]